MFSNALLNAAALLSRITANYSVTVALSSLGRCLILNQLSAQKIANKLSTLKLSSLALIVVKI